MTDASLVERITRLSGDAVTPETLAAMLRLRAEVFVVEQVIAYNDLEPPIDLLATTAHYFAQDDDDAIVAYLRSYPHDDARKIGRVVTAASVRGAGFGAALMDAVIAAESDRLVLSSQLTVADFYSRWGFVCVGEPYLEEGIEHIWKERRPD